MKFCVLIFKDGDYATTNLRAFHQLLCILVICTRMFVVTEILEICGARGTVYKALDLRSGGLGFDSRRARHV